MSYPELDLIVLKGIITNKQQALDFVGSNSVNVFDSSLWNTANLIINYVKTYKDVPTLNVLIDKISKTTPALADTITIIWGRIATASYNEKEFKHQVEKIQNRFSTNQLMLLKDKLDATDFDNTNPNKVVDDLKKVIHTVAGVTQTKTYDRKTLKESIAPFREEIAAKLANPDFDRGILTHYSFLDTATEGLKAGELVIIGGESSSGKSMLLSNICCQMWMQDNKIDMTDKFSRGHNVLYFSLEMPLKACRNRIYSRLSGVPTKLIKRPINQEGKSRLSGDDRAKLKTAIQFIDRYPNQFEIVDIPRGATMSDIERIFLDAKTQYNPEIVAIDYLGLLEDDSKEDDWLKLGVIAGKCHEFARANNIIVLTAVQLNRARTSSKEADDKVGMHRIGRSALIMTHADQGIQIETRSNEKNYPDMLVHMIKVRDGELTRGKLLKNLGSGTLLDETINGSDQEEDFTNFDDISEKIAFFDI